MQSAESDLKDSEIDEIQSQPSQEKPVKEKSYRDMTPAEIEAAIDARKHITNEHFDLDYMRFLGDEILELARKYFRQEFVNFDDLHLRSEQDHSVIYASNHSGMAFPWDAMIFVADLFKRHDYDKDKLFMSLAAPALSASNLMNPYIVKDFWKRTGSVDAYGINFDTMMKHNKDFNLLVYPEGVPGIGKGFHKRYQLQTFSTSLIRMSIKYKADIVGVSCINGEYINPHTYAWIWLNKMTQKFGIPYIPLGLNLPLLFLCPWMFYYGMPAKLTYIKGNTYKPYEKVNGRSLEEVSDDEIRAIRDELQADMQVELNKGVAKYGKDPYRWKEFRKTFRENLSLLPLWGPFGWPAVFTDLEYRYTHKNKEAKTYGKGGIWEFLKILKRHPFVISYYIPILGWIPILMKGMKGRKKVKEWTPNNNK